MPILLPIHISFASAGDESKSMTRASISALVGTKKGKNLLWIHICHLYWLAITWMCTVSLFDTLTLSPLDQPGVSLTCDDPSLPTDGRNLVVRAAQALADHSGLAVRLEKRIPSGAGLGGGSSDAARALLGIAAMFALKRRTSGL